MNPLQERERLDGRRALAVVGQVGKDELVTGALKKQASKQEKGNTNLDGTSRLWFSIKQLHYVHSLVLHTWAGQEEGPQVQSPARPAQGSQLEGDVGSL